MGICSVDLDVDDLIETFAEDGNFYGDFLYKFALAVHAGLLLDDACDISAGFSKEKAKFVSNQITGLGKSMKSGWEMSHGPM